MVYRGGSKTVGVYGKTFYVAYYDAPLNFYQNI